MPNVYLFIYGFTHEFFKTKLASYYFGIAAILDYCDMIKFPSQIPNFS